MTIILCAPQATEIIKRVDYCPTCKRETEFMAEFYEWYGPNEICLECGEEFNDNEQTPRPFRRGWREENKKRARERLQNGTP